MGLGWGGRVSFEGLFMSHVPFSGLSSTEVEESRSLYGVNLLTPPERDPWWKQWLSKFDDPVIRILIIAASIQIGIGIFHGGIVEGLAIIAAILLATTLAFANEFRANREFDILNQVHEEIPVKVIRNRAVGSVARSQIVVGDVILLDAGEEIPADGVVLQESALMVDESKLTGESVPSRKTLSPLTEETAFPADKVFRGCIVSEGSGIIRITEVGDNTEIAKTARAAGDSGGEHSPLNLQLEKLSKLIGVVGFGIASFLFAALLLRGVSTGNLSLTGIQWGVFSAFGVGALIALVPIWLPIVLDGLEFLAIPVKTPDWLEKDGASPWLKALLWGGGLGGLLLAVVAMVNTIGAQKDSSFWLDAEHSKVILDAFMIAVVVIVVAVPEGLAMSVTLSLAYSMRKMTQQNNLVRRLNACETMGAVTVICTDKTGTLTLNQMRVVGAHPASDALETRELLNEGIAVNSTAQLTVEDGVVRPLGNPTEGALLLWSEGLGEENTKSGSTGGEYLSLRAGHPILWRSPFKADLKWMATAVRGEDGHSILHVKGAPEILLSLCTHIQSGKGKMSLSESDSKSIHKDLLDAQKKGQRTIALAARILGTAETISFQEVTGLTWLGWFAVEDPLRHDVREAVAACKSAGIEIKVVTGDTGLTAWKIAQDAGIAEGVPTPQTSMTGPEFAALDDARAMEAAKKLRVLSRARPLDKLRMVDLLKKAGEVVAVTGDGTNDAPALNHAQVGLSMGKSGTAAAKEASDIVILDDSFASIINAVKWGRSLYENIQRFIVFQLTINVVALSLAVMGPFLGVGLPLTVMQMLWVNLIMDTFAALALATEPAREEVLRRKPRSKDAFIITREMAWRIFGVGGLFLLVSLLTLRWFFPGGMAEDNLSPAEIRGSTILFSGFVLLQFCNLFWVRNFRTKRHGLAGIGQNPAFLAIAIAILAGQILITQFGGSFFRTVALDGGTWSILLGLTLGMFLLVEIWTYAKNLASKSH